MAGGMERVMLGFDLEVVGSGFAGPTATSSFLEATEKAGAVVLACGDQKGELLWTISTR